MEKPEDAARCIENLHKRELHGNLILVESATPESSSRQEDKPRTDATTAKERHKSTSKDPGSSRKDDHQPRHHNPVPRGVSSSRSVSAAGRAHSSGRSVHDVRRAPGNRAPAAPNLHRREDKGAAATSVLTFHQIKDQRKRELEREEERRRRER
jgi:hypothetical protein